MLHAFAGGNPCSELEAHDSFTFHTICVYALMPREFIE